LGGRIDPSGNILILWGDSRRKKKWGHTKGGAIGREKKLLPKRVASTGPMTEGGRMGKGD